MPDLNDVPPSNGGKQDPSGITGSEHSRLRSGQGRPIAEIVNDVQKAAPKDVFIQPDDARFVVRGVKGREHIIEPDGVHVTSVRRPDAAHQARLRHGTIRAATPEEYQKLKDFVQ